MKRLWTMLTKLFTRRQGRLSEHRRDIVESQNVRTVTEAIGDLLEDEVKERIELVRRETEVMTRDHHRRFPPHGAGV